MRTQITFPAVVFFLQMAASLGLVSTPAAASTFWNGPNTNYTQSGDSDVLVPGAVAFGRGINAYIYNSVTEGGPGIGSPSDTTWAVGSASMIGNLSATTVSGLTFIPFAGTTPSVRSTAQGPPWFSVNPYIMTGSDSGGPITFVVHLIQEDTYLTLTFTSWGQHFAGGFGYARSTPSAGVTPPPPPTPSVTITNPVNGAVFAAPANVRMGADATVSSGTVTNVLFFGNANLLGSSQAPPFTITANGLTSGNYALTAVALAGGISATSAVVNISVVTPVATSLTAAPASVTNGQFSFSYSATPGLRYEVDISSNLFSWTPVATNVATGNLVLFTNNISGAGNFFRVGRVPNP